MNNKKYLNTFLASTVAASMVAPQIADAQTAKFNDINKSYAKQNIEYLAKKGIISGVEKNKYSPSAVMNRESFAALLGKTIKLKEKASGSSYKDVSPWAQGMVGALEEKKLVSGIGKGYFGAKMPVTREQMAVFYVRALGYEEEAIKLKDTMDHNSEGWVLRWSNGMRLKIKGNSYLDIHKIAYGLSDKLKTEYWALGNIEELILKMPEEFRKEIEGFKSILDRQLIELTKSIDHHHSSASVHSSDRKSFAIYVNQHVPRELKYLVYKRADGKLTEQTVKEHIYKNYLSYKGEIE